MTAPEAPKKNRIISAWYRLRQYVVDLTAPKAPKENPTGAAGPPCAPPLRAQPGPPCPPCPTPLEIREGLHTRFARLFFGVITLLVLYYSYLIIKPYLLNIFMALVLFFTAKPLYHGLTRLLRGYKVLASALTCIILLLIVLIPLFSLMGIIAAQALEFSSQVTQGMQAGDLWSWFNAKVEALKLYLTHLNLPLPPGDINLAQIVQTAVSKSSAFIYTNAIGLIKGFTVFFFDLLLTLFITFFMFLQGDDFIKAIKGLSPMDPACAQGALGGVGFWIFGISQPAFWGTVMVPAAVIPVVGSTIIWGPAAVYLLFTGHIGAGVGLILWGGVVVSVIDNILKPILVKGGGETPSIFILFSILGGLTYFGMIGFILGPLILSFLLSLLRIYQKTILVPAAATRDIKIPTLSGDGS
jgi:predicted PurR-regulated permease PerM